MPISQPATTSTRGNGAAWVRLRPTDSSAAANGCSGFGFLVFGAVFVAAGIGALVVGRDPVSLLFVFAGLFVAAIGGRLLLAAVGPRPHLWAERTKVEAGETFKVRWEASGRFREASSMRVTWEGREIAIERNYDATQHISSFVARVVTSEIGPLAGTASIVVPKEAMPSFTGKNALIEWRLRAEVQTRRWPDVEERYVIVVLPSRLPPT